ncbi:hypothetical protein DXG01_016669 [Tephrocybe rancida]|nr:hypothetical protein DXG01_016669 [Tephrocybe rancida]
MDPCSVDMLGEVAHVPDMSTFDGILDIMMLCNWFEFSDVFSPWGYNKKLSTVFDLNRVIKMRVVACMLLNWAFNNFSFEFEADQSTIDEYGPDPTPIPGDHAMSKIHHLFLAQQGHALIKYKKAAFQSDLGNVFFEEHDVLVTPKRKCVLFVLYMDRRLNVMSPVNNSIHGLTSAGDINTGVPHKVDKLEPNNGPKTGPGGRSNCKHGTSPISATPFVVFSASNAIVKCYSYDVESEPVARTSITPICARDEDLIEKGWRLIIPGEMLFAHYTETESYVLHVWAPHPHAVLSSHQLALLQAPLDSMEAFAALEDGAFGAPHIDSGDVQKLRRYMHIKSTRVITKWNPAVLIKPSEAEGHCQTSPYIGTVQVTLVWLVTDQAIWEAVSAHTAEEALLEKLMEYWLIDTVQYTSGRPQREHEITRNPISDLSHLPLTRLDDCEALFQETKQNFQHFLDACDITGNVDASSLAEKVMASLFNAMTFPAQVWRDMHSWPKPEEAAKMERVVWKTVFHVVQGHSIRDSIAQAFESIDEIALSWAKGWFTKPLAVPRHSFSAHIESEEEEDTNQPGPTPAPLHYAPPRQIPASMLLGYAEQQANHQPPKTAGTNIQNPPEPANAAGRDTDANNSGGDGPRGETVQQDSASGGGGSATTVFCETSRSGGTIPPTSKVQHHPESISPGGDGPHPKTAQQGGADSSGDGAATKLASGTLPHGNAENEPHQSADATTSAADGDTDIHDAEGGMTCPEASQQDGVDGGGDGDSTKLTDEIPPTQNADDEHQQSPAASANAAGGDVDHPNIEANRPQPDLSQHGPAVGGGNSATAQPTSETPPHDAVEDRPQQISNVSANAQHGETEAPNAGGNAPRLILPVYNPGPQPVGSIASGDPVEGHPATTSTPTPVDEGAPGHQSGDNAADEQTVEEHTQGTGQDGPSSGGKGDSEPKPKPKPKSKQKAGYEQDGVWFKKVSSKLFKQVVVIDLEADCDKNDTQYYPLRTYTGRKDSIPTMKLRWGMVSMGNTSQDFRIAPNRFATVMKVHSGRKLIIVAQPRSKQGVVDHSASIDIYTGNIENKVLNRKLFDLQSLVLESDDTMLLHPNTLYFSVNMDPTICEVGHFYNTSVIRNSVFGIYHELVTRICDPSHSVMAGHLLACLLVFYEKYLTKPPHSSTVTEHLPILTLFEGVLDMMVLCNLFKLSDLFRAFTDMFKTSATMKESKTKSLPVLDTYHIVRLQAIACRLIKWIFFNYTFQFADDEDSNSEMSVDGNSDDGNEYMTGEEALDTIYQPFLLHQGRALVEYISSVAAQREGEDVKEDIFTEKHIKPTSFKSAMELHLEAMNIQDDCAELTSDECTLLWMGKKFTVHQLAEYTKVDLSVDSLTATDAAYGLDPESFPSFHEKQLLSDDERTEESPRKRRRTTKQK